MSFRFLAYQELVNIAILSEESWERGGFVMQGNQESVSGVCTLRCLLAMQTKHPQEDVK